MARLLFGRLATALVAGLALVCSLPGQAQAQNSQKISFETMDKVMLRGTFYPSAKDGKKSPPVLLLHKLGGDRGSAGFDSLAKALQDKGFAVLSFDFRGHGDSTNVKADFWKYACNTRCIKGAKATKEEIDYKEFTASYYPYLLNDVAAAKFELEKRNNASECNVNDLIVIGAEDGGTLAALWIATEFQRYTTSPNPKGAFFPPIRATEPEGKDVAAAVYLSLRPTLGSGTKELRVSPGSWFTKDARLRDKVGMFFLYGDNDEVSSKFAKYIFDDTLRAPQLKNKLLFKTPVKETKLAGAELIKKGLSTEEWIVRYCADQVMEKRPAAGWVERDLKQNPLVAVPANVVANFGVTMP
jgi:pimeloyl-ACP methyl ester carboxylesterase